MQSSDVNVEDGSPAKPRRRRFTRRTLLRLIGGGVLAAGGGAAYARFLEPFWPTVEHIDMSFPRLAPPLQNLRILQLSDLHLSTRVPIDYLRKQLQRCLSLKPDLIAITGDFVTIGNSKTHSQLTSLLQTLHAPFGVFAVLGNHDCGAYSARTPAGIGARRADSVSQAISSAGVTVLRNESHVLGIRDARLQLVGLDDLWSGFCDPDRAFAGVDPSLPCIALAHNPDVIDQIREMPSHWILCGHTHGGQVRIPFYGAPLLPVRNRQYDAGLFSVGQKRLYVNRGLGYLRPIRFNCRPEITLFTLTQRA